VRVTGKQSVRVCEREREREEERKEVRGQERERTSVCVSVQEIL